MAIPAEQQANRAEPPVAVVGNRRVLLVDDNPAIHEDYLKILQPRRSDAGRALDQAETELFGDAPRSTAERFDVDLASQGEEAVRMVAEARAAGRPYALAFVDVRMPPGLDGVETAGRLWAADPDVQVVICSAYSDHSWSDLLERLGASDRWVLLKKPFDAIEVRQLALAFTRKWDAAREHGRLAASLEDLVRQRTEALEAANAALTREIEKVREAEARIQHMAQHDALTGLPNRRFLEWYLAKQVDSNRRADRCLGVLCIDLDRFKRVNDTLGHAAGDLVLRCVSERLTSSTRSGDFVVRFDRTGPEGHGVPAVARLGGDEFVLVFPELSRPDDAALIAERVGRVLGRAISVEGREICLGASIGIALQPLDGQDADTLLRKAEEAMHAVKEAGRGGFRFHSEIQQRRTGDRLWLENALRKAIAQGELEVHYQPEMEAARNAPVAAEALVRWRHPERGPISPAEFIPVAEESGLVVALGAYVLERACTQLARWRAEGTPLTRVAVNVSARQLLSGDLSQTVAEALGRAGLPPAMLELELTEGALIQEREEIDRTLRELDTLGVRIALDDFGTGYSSLKHVTRWPIHALKIDRSFVGGLPGDRHSAGVVKSIIALARCFDVRVVAEGVETDAQRDALVREGCTHLQGFLFSPALPPGDLVRWLNRP